MFKYLLLFSVTFYLILLIGGQDNGQERMGLRGAYDIALAPPTPEVTLQATETASAVPQPPVDTLRILPAPSDAPTVQPASVTIELPAEPAFNDFNNPTVTLRTITADAANVRDAPARSGNVIGRLENGEIVQILETNGDWVHVRIEGDGIDGFVHRRLISTDPPGLTTTELFPAVD